MAQDARCESATKSLDQIVVILDSLSLRLSHTVALSLEEQRVGLTWKERSAASGTVGVHATRLPEYFHPLLMRTHRYDRLHLKYYSYSYSAWKSIKKYPKRLSYRQ